MVDLTAFRAMINDVVKGSIFNRTYLLQCAARTCTNTTIIYYNMVAEVGQGVLGTSAYPHLML